MILLNSVRRFLVMLVATATVSLASPVFAQDISATHMKAARDAVAAIRATDLFDEILPASAMALKQALIEKNPDLDQLITATVDQKAFEMATRRTDLEKEAATAYAKVFSEANLTEIAAFYNSDTGKKLLSDGPIVTRELSKAADIWQRGISRDLAQEVGKVLTASLEASQPAAQEPAPAADGEAPAPAPAN